MCVLKVADWFQCVLGNFFRSRTRFSASHLILVFSHSLPTVINCCVFIHFEICLHKRLHSWAARRWRLHCGVQSVHLCLQSPPPPTCAVQRCSQILSVVRLSLPRLEVRWLVIVNYDKGFNSLSCPRAFLASLQLPTCVWKPNALISSHKHYNMWGSSQAQSYKLPYKGTGWGELSKKSKWFLAFVSSQGKHSVNVGWLKLVFSHM